MASTNDYTAASIGFDRRSIDRARKGGPKPEAEHLFRTVDFYISRRLAPIDRYLKTKMGTPEALIALEACR